MSDVVMCSVKDAKELLEHLSNDDMLTLTIFSKKTYEHFQNKRIYKRNGEELIDQADTIEYQDNDIFGRLSLYGVLPEDDIIHNLLFAQKHIDNTN